MTTLIQLKTWLQSTTSTRVVLVEVENVTSAPNTPLLLSNRPYMDTNTNNQYISCIVGGVTFTESINLTGGVPQIGYGDIEIDNTPTNDVGPRDDWLGWVWGNKRVTVSIGDVTWIRGDFYTVFTGLVKDINSKSRTTLNLILTDNTQRLNTAVSDQLLTNVFNTNLSIPATFGECFNITPLLVDPSTLQYKVHPGTIAEIIEVRDNGAPLSFTGNSTSNVDLTAGTFTLARTPVGTITCTVRGSAPSGTHRQYIGETIRDILTNYGNKLLDTTYIDNTNFVNFDAVSNTVASTGTQARCGVFLNSRENVLETCNRIANSIGAYLVTGLDGKFRLKQVAAVATGTGTHTVSQTDMEQKTFAVREKLEVQGAVKIAYCKNWTVQSSGLAAGVVQQSATIFAQPSYFVNSSDSTVLSSYTQSSEPPPRETLLIEKAAAQAECNRLLTFYKTPRFVYTATYYSHLLAVELGDTINVTYPRFGLSGGKSGTIVEINRDWLKGRVTLGILI